MIDKSDFEYLEKCFTASPLAPLNQAGTFIYTIKIPEGGCLEMTDEGKRLLSEHNKKWEKSESGKIVSQIARQIIEHHKSKQPESVNRQTKPVDYFEEVVMKGIDIGPYLKAIDGRFLALNKENKAIVAKRIYKQLNTLISPFKGTESEKREFIKRTFGAPGPSVDGYEWYLAQCIAVKYRLADRISELYKEHGLGALLSNIQTEIKFDLNNWQEVFIDSCERQIGGKEKIKKMPAIQRAALLYYYKSQLPNLFPNTSANRVDQEKMKTFDKWRYKGSDKPIKNQLENNDFKKKSRAKHYNDFKEELSPKSSKYGKLN